VIVVDRGSELRFVTQPDHAHLAGEILALWRADGLPEHSRRTDVLFAGREHDNGWREADAAPRWDAAAGRPRDFVTTTTADRIEIWERGTARFAGSHPYAALLVVRHAQALHRDRAGDPAWQGFLAYLDELARGLLEETGAAPDEVDADYRFLDLADLISLSALNRAPERFARHGMVGRRDDRETGGETGIETVHLSPFPLAGATAFEVPCRRIPNRSYAGDADLGGELVAARWETVRVRLAPGL
jgi:hypothetical protein